MAVTKACRHRDSWLIGGGCYEWCYRCGALRRMRELGIAQVEPDSLWVRPVGPSKPNPWRIWRDKTERFLERRSRRLGGATE